MFLPADRIFEREEVEDTFWFVGKLVRRLANWSTWWFRLATCCGRDDRRTGSWGRRWGRSRVWHRSRRLLHVCVGTRVSRDFSPDRDKFMLVLGPGNNSLGAGGADHAQAITQSGQGCEFDGQ